MSRGVNFDGRHEEIPFVGVEVFEDANGAVGFFARGFEKMDSAGLHGLVVVPEVVGVKKKKDASAGLIPDGTNLLRCGSLCEEKTSAVPCRFYYNPALSVTERPVFSQLKT